MSVDEKLDQPTTIEQWCSSVKAGDQVLHIRNGSSVLHLSHRDSSVCGWLAPGWQGLLAWRQGLQVVEGSAEVLPLSCASLVKLQFFIDQGVEPDFQVSNSQPWAALSDEGAKHQTLAELESWYLAQCLQGGWEHREFAQHLRRSESYQLLGFLLERGAHSEKLRDLAGRYGVSVSHFRRLCRQALGGAAKSELRDWRAAKALLTMVEGTGSLTDVALEFGYASSSHFSKEVRELVGVAPSSLIDITRLSSV
ncbi:MULTISPECIES: helix-turn-helix domain-containing protein [Pseudomonas]|jgi:AraC-like DNA-binding protein|uniref:helix-turn-helix domain-containing protein n=1 Tax=Pseudomonas TaxID=286 RepID=UPI00099D5F93|nr:MULTISPECIES: AraC family transcriptional regulator [Pseudomonas]MCK3838860.1 AraC family transcriptional regulator [Pseudomonas sp. NCIMB 10586]VCU67871.1 Invasion protein InvF [Pseudomonas synxantha]